MKSHTKSPERSRAMEVFKHFSHQHALRPFKIRQGNEGFGTCSGCELDLSEGPAYRCTKPRCDFFLHDSCFSLPQQLNHDSHPNHALTLLSPPPYSGEEFICNACGDSGSAFVYHCSPCTYDLHVGCARLPDSVKHEDHPHPLALLFPNLVPETEDANGVFTCDVCDGTVTDQCWVYCCQECNFHTHLDCATKAADQPKESESDISAEEGEGEGEEGEALDSFGSLLEAQRRLHLVQLQSHLNIQKAQVLAGFGKNISNLIG